MSMTWVCIWATAAWIRSRGPGSGPPRRRRPGRGRRRRRCSPRTGKGRSRRAGRGRSRRALPPDGQQLFVQPAVLAVDGLELRGHGVHPAASRATSATPPSGTRASKSPAPTRASTSLTPASGPAPRRIVQAIGGGEDRQQADDHQGVVQAAPHLVDLVDRIGLHQPDRPDPLDRGMRVDQADEPGGRRIGGRVRARRQPHAAVAVQPDGPDVAAAAEHPHHAGQDRVGRVGGAASCRPVTTAWLALPMAEASSASTERRASQTMAARRRPPG